MAFNRNILLRRISALLLFALLLMAFAALFVYKIEPDNRWQLNQRGHKVLTQQVQNFLRKDQDLHNIIESAGSHFTELEGRKEPYDRLFANLHYDTTTDLPSGFPGHLLKTDSGAWLIIHHRDNDKADSTKARAEKPDSLTRRTPKKPTAVEAPSKRIYLTVKMKDFADPLFAGRDDVFKDYLILLDTGDSAGTGEGSPTGLSLLYQQSPLSASARFNADTTRKLTPNSDESGTFDLSMAGERYIAFFSRFEFHQYHLMLVGLIDKDAYTTKINATPTLFLPLVIILICLALIGLPFLKVFLLSPHECISGRDVLKMALSFFAGGVAITIIVFYFFLSYVTSMSLENRLKHFSRLVRADVEEDIRSANDQLNSYSCLGWDLPRTDTLMRRLATDLPIVPTDSLESQLDILCVPDTNVLVSRLFWLDTLGQTVAKWSPFVYPTPFTKMNNYAFFQLLINKPFAYNGFAGVDEPVVYPGKSNLTDEFQTFIARQTQATWLRRSSKAQDTSICASFIVIAAMLRSTIHPVIPPDFCFSIIDDNGNVLVDGDSRKSLAGNLFEESEQNKSLKDAVHFDKSDWVFSLNIRGVAYVARVTPIAGQPLHLVCYYSKDTVRKNVNRMMHFCIETLVVLWFLLGICLLLSTFHQWKPVILKFNYEKIEWIRPASIDKAKLSAISTWLLLLTGIAICLFAGVGLWSDTLAPLFYLALLPPFYVVLGVQVFHKWKGKYYSIIALLVLHAVIIWLIHASGSGWGGLVVAGVFDVLAVGALLGVFYGRADRAKQVDGKGEADADGKGVEPADAKQKGPAEGKDVKEADADREKNRRWPRVWFRWVRDVWERNEYFGALLLSIILISILPALGILNYAFFAEKAQFKKGKLEAVSTAFEKRSNYLMTNLLPSYKASVRNALGDRWNEKLLFNSSIYLTDRDAIVRAPETSAGGGDAGHRKSGMPDALYSLLMDDCYFAPLVWDDEATIPDSGPYGHGEYSMAGDVVQYAPGWKLADPQQRGLNSFVVQSHLQKPHSDLQAIFWPVGLFTLLVLLALAYLACKLVRGAIHHLFLMEIAGNAKRFEKKGTVVETAIAGYAPKEKSWMPEVNKLYEKEKVCLGSLEFERSFAGWPVKEEQPEAHLQTDFILAMTDYLRPVYDEIFWKKLESDEERYVLSDFASDRYTNYKNSAVLYRLLCKGVLVSKDEYLDLFSLSFRQYVLTLPDGENAEKLLAVQRKYRVPGTWQSIRIPAIAILLVMAVFLFATQPQISTFIAGLAVLATSLTTVLAFVRSSLPAREIKQGEDGAPRKPGNDQSK